MDIELYFRFFLALGFTILLILGLSWAFRRYVSGKSWGAGRPGRRLSIVEILPVDNRRRLVLVRRDQREHLIMLGTSSDLVVESDILPPPENTDRDQTHNPTMSNPHPIRAAEGPAEKAKS